MISLSGKLSGNIGILNKFPGIDNLNLGLLLSDINVCIIPLLLIVYCGI